MINALLPFKMDVFNIPRKHRRTIVGCCIALFCVANWSLSWDDSAIIRNDNGHRVARHLAADTSRMLEAFEDRPMMYTFFEPIPADERRTGMNDDQDVALLKAWRESWEEAGWNTKVLTLDDAKRHPHFDELLEKLQDSSKNNKQARYENLCFLRWLAVAAAGGGWMSDYDVFPLTLTGEVGSTLPNDGIFTAHDGPVPALLSGTHKEWDRMAHEVINAASEMTDYISDMLALQFIAENKPEIEFIRERGVLREVAYDAINKVDCTITKDKNSVHFSHRRMYEAWEKGLMPHLTDFHDAPGERPHYSKKFLSDWSFQCGKRRPTIYTFETPEGPDGMLLPAQNEALIKLWTKIWGQFGWQVKILTEDDAKKNPKYNQLNEQLQKITAPELRLPYFKLLAMGTLENGGWYSDYDTFPLYMGGDDINLPNEGKFTLYDGYLPTFMSAKPDEWSRITDLIISTLKEMDKEKDDFSLVSIFQNLWKKKLEGPSVSNNQIYRISRQFQERSDKFVCGDYRKRRAAHFRFSFLPADILYAAPLFYEKWEENCVDKSNERKLGKSTSLVDKLLSTMFEH